MGLDTTEEILLILLSTALALFLLFGIIALVKIIQLLNYMKRLAEKAEALADKANSVGEVFRKAAAPIAIGRFFTYIADATFWKKDKNGKRKND